MGRHPEFQVKRIIIRTLEEIILLGGRKEANQVFTCIGIANLGQVGFIIAGKILLAR